MQAGSEEIQNFREELIRIGNQLDFQVGTLLHGFLTEATERLEIHQVKLIERNEPMGNLQQVSTLSVFVLRILFFRI